MAAYFLKEISIRFVLKPITIQQLHFTLRKFAKK